MLRVITERRGQVHMLELHGVLGGDWVAVLEMRWRSITDAVPCAKVTVVMSEVEFIDPDGEQLLDRMADDGVEFVVSGSMNRYVVERLRRARRAREHEAGSDVTLVRQEPGPSAGNEGGVGAGQQDPANAVVTD